MVEHVTASVFANFRRFFVRGLAILLPTVVTIWILMWAYGFINAQVAAPINAGLRQLILATTPYPEVGDAELDAYIVNPPAGEWINAPTDRNSAEYQAFRQALRQQMRHERLLKWWRGTWLPLDLIGLTIGIVLIYAVGALVGGYIGAKLQQRGEGVIQRLPLVRKLYPSVKQVTDFIVGGEEKRLKFNRVVAVEYPRKGMWSLGLVTGGAPRAIQEHAGQECLAIFVPSSPAPITGWVILAKREDTIDLPMTIEDALRFVVSGGVIVPPGQQLPAPEHAPALVLPVVAS